MTYTCTMNQDSVVADPLLNQYNDTANKQCYNYENDQKLYYYPRAVLFETYIIMHRVDNKTIIFGAKLKVSFHKPCARDRCLF